MKLKCKCGYLWNYKGKHLQASCPHCNNKVKVMKGGKDGKNKINSIEKKMSKKGTPFWVVKYNETGDATIGAWDAQLADYIEKDVGIGGTVSVVITQKGEYTNITEVDMTSGVKTLITESENVFKEGIKEAIKPEETFYSAKDRMIVAQCLTKVCYGDTGGHKEQSVIATYNYFLDNL